MAFSYWSLQQGMEGRDNLGGQQSALVSVVSAQAGGSLNAHHVFPQPSVVPRTHLKSAGSPSTSGATKLNSAHISIRLFCGAGQDEQEAGSGHVGLQGCAGWATDCRTC